MKLIIEIESEEERERAERIAKYIKASSVEVSEQIQEKKIESFLNKIDEIAIQVDEIAIPSRDERNAR